MDKNLPRVFLDETDLECSGVEYHWCSANQIDTFNIEYLPKKEHDEIVRPLLAALAFYAAEDRWIAKKEFAEDDLVGHRHDDEKGECVAVPIKKGQYMGTSYRPAAKTQADRGKRAKEAIEEYEKNKT